MIILFFFSLVYNKKLFRLISSVLLSSILIVFVFVPLMPIILQFFEYHDSTGYAIWRLIRFGYSFGFWAVLPIIIFRIICEEKKYYSLPTYGVQRENLFKSVKLFLLCSLIIVPADIASFVFDSGFLLSPETPLIGSITFLDTFNEEFFFRGILFIVLLNNWDLRIAYIMSVSCFVLAHPRYLPFSSGLIFVTIMAVLASEICRRSKNITGAWLLHGTHNTLLYAVLPYFFIPA